MKDAFIQHLLASYQSFCMNKQVIPSMINFLDYLINYNFISDTSVRHYVLLQEFERRKGNEDKKNKTQIVKEMSHTFSIHETSVWNILKDHKEKFMEKSDMGIKLGKQGN